MKELQNEVQTSEFMEYNRAAAKFGPANNGPHESYAVILEEFQEAQEEAETFENELTVFWNGVRANVSAKSKEDQLIYLRHIAERAAAEWIQVAAMCYKATVKKDGK